jgi:glucose/arabinose dehydrogenase
LSGERVGREKALFSEIQARIRDVRVGPDGLLYILTPDTVIRVRPNSESG